VGLGVKIAGVEASDVGEQRLRELPPLDLVVAERVLQ
jgi:hypothetical protein